MKKILFLSVAFFGVLICAQPTQAATQITLNQAPYLIIYPDQFDQLVLDFTVNTQTTDALKALTVSNTLGAAEGREIKKMVLWQDNGDNIFEGLAKDKVLGEALYNWDEQYWYWTGLNASFSNQARFYISLETMSRNYITTISAVKMSLHAFLDKNSNKLFDNNDRGIFLGSGNNGPVSNMENAASQEIRPFSGDSVGPKAVIVTPTNTQTIIANNFLISGVGRDQGPAGIVNIKVYANDIFLGEAVSIDPGFATWEYNWQNLQPGIYNLKITAEDSFGNMANPADSISVTVSHQLIDASHSSVSADKTIIKADGFDKATVTCLVKDQDNLAIVGRAPVFIKSSNVNINMINAVTDSQGQLKFTASCQLAGNETIGIKFDNVQIGSLNFNCQPATTTGYGPGDIIKANNYSEVYYYATDGKRYVFPSLNIFTSWYADFSTLKIITFSQLSAIPLGGTVTYRPGVKMVKIQSDARVYAIGPHATLRWITSEEAAKSLFGTNWQSLVDDIAPTFFTDYDTALPINQASDFDRQAITTAASSISVDKGM